MDDVDVLIAQTVVPGFEASRARENFGVAVAAGDCLVYVTPPGDVAGFVTTSVRSFFGRDFIGLIVVSPDHRRFGIGTELMGAAASQATTDTVFTSTNESNFAMRQLLARQDWTFSGTLTGIDEGDPELVYWTEVKNRSTPLHTSK